MMRTLLGEGENLLFCDGCGSGYLSEVTVRKCRDWLAERKSCSLDIVKNAVPWE